MLAASPIFATNTFFATRLKSLLAADKLTEATFGGWFGNFQQNADVISSPDQAFDVLDFEPAARKALPPAHFGYLATGVDDDATVRANREGYSRIQIRSRRLVDVGKIDTSVRLLGATWSSPIVICPMGGEKAFHPEGDIAVARAAARGKDHLQMLSTVATSSIEDVIAARGGPVWQQLYPTNIWEVGRAIVKRAQAAGSPAIVFTVDLQESSNFETLFRGRQADTRECSNCHKTAFPGFARGRAGAAPGGFSEYVARKPMFDGLDLSKVTSFLPRPMDWDFVKRLRDTVTVKLFLKGIVTREDAQLAAEHGVDGLVVSNHAGREETLRPTIESLPEVLAGVTGKIPVIVDGGIRRGTDMFKALAMGATAVGIGRPVAWGLAAFGQPGVEAVLEILRRELEAIMRQAGTPSVDKITRSYVVTRPS